MWTTSVCMKGSRFEYEMCGQNLQFLVFEVFCSSQGGFPVKWQCWVRHSVGRRFYPFVLKEMAGTWGDNEHVDHVNLHERFQVRIWEVCGQNLQFSVFDVFLLFLG